MKWVCLALLVGNLVLAAVAGYQLMVVPDSEVREVREQAMSWIQEQQKAGAQMVESMNERESGTYISNEGGDITYSEYDDLDDLEYRREDEEEEEDDRTHGGMTSRTAEAEFIVDQSAAMQMNTFPGVTKSREKIRNIEKGRRDLHQYGNDALNN